MSYKNETGESYLNLFDAAIALYSPSINSFINADKIKKYRSNTFNSSEDLYIYKDIHSNALPSTNVFIQDPNPDLFEGSSFTSDNIILTYLPFISNCDNLGVHISMRDIFEHKGCKIIKEKDTKGFYFYNLFATATADICNFNTTCFYDERLDVKLYYL